MYKTLIFTRQEIETAVRERSDYKNFNFWELQEYNNDCAIPYIVGLRREKESPEYDEYMNDEIRFQNDICEVIDKYMIDMGAKFNDKVWIDVTW